ncbi:MAG: glutamate 5-kinase [Alphaproteobacteria bacterium]|nr:glutamate 5-kinase [Alphaproteobacteria bacterium]
MFKDAKRIVIKVGSSLIIGDSNAARKDWLASLASDIAQLKKQNKEVIVVTSGAVALGRSPLGYGARALELEEKQAAAACGQITLFSLWAETLGAVSLSPAQILLTADDSIHRRRYLNARNTLDTLLENARVVPVINENDTVATAELRFGDNDRLAARVAQMAGADMLVLFSDIDGLYTADPRTNKDATFIAEVTEISDDIEAMAGGAGSSVGTGGMATKIAAAKIATAAGCHMVIARGTENNPLKALADGGKHTLFIAKESPLSARKHWIAGGLHPSGIVYVDGGAATALKGGKSLLPAGVKAVEGCFDLGDAVLIKTESDKLIGKGLIAYSADDAARIIGKKSSEIEQILGFKRRDVLIHRDDMVLE